MSIRSYKGLYDLPFTNWLCPSRLMESAGIYRIQCHRTCVLILAPPPPHLRLGVPSSSVLTGFRTVSIFQFSHTCNFPRTSHSRYDHPSIICLMVQSINLLIEKLSPAACYFLPLRHKYSFPPPKPESRLFPRFSWPWCIGIHSFWRLSKKTVSSLHYITELGMINKLERIWKEKVVA
jgi:hypothetical protein